MWIKRDLSNAIGLNRDFIQLLRGPWQCGKTSLLLELGAEFVDLSLDDLGLRELARANPDLLLSQHPGQPLLIDEAQYAPELFPALKRRADLAARAARATTPSLPAKTHYRLTGSNQILMDREIKESLAGRASFFDLHTLSVRELDAHFGAKISTQQILFQGGWPELYANPSKAPVKYLDDYISSVIEKDVVLSAGIQRRREFLQFTRMLAGRVGTLLELNPLARDLGIDQKTARGWLSALETMSVIALVAPYSSNLSKRLVKSPKFFFLDTGLACRLQGWTSAQAIITSPQQGGLFENLVFSEIHRTIINFQTGWRVYHWRTRDGHEVDFLIEFEPGRQILIEAKVSAPGRAHVARAGERSTELAKVFRNVPDTLVCHLEGDYVLENRVPIRRLAGKLLELGGIRAQGEGDHALKP